MRAVRVVKHADPVDAISVEEVPEPEPGPGEVRVAVAAASLNFGDIARCRGGVATVLPDPPFTLGMDVCGTVDAAGPGMEEWLGRRVVGMSPQALGGMAEKALVGTVFDAPPSLSDVEAAAFLLPCHLAYLSLVERARLEPGETVLVRGAASAVGTAAVQLAVTLGARVIALAGSAEKRALCAGLGAEVVLDQGREDLFAAVMEATGDRGADVIFDPIGGAQTETLWTMGALGARYLAVGFNDDPEGGLTGRPLRKVSMANLSVLGVLLAYLDLPVEFRQFGLHPFPPEVGRRVHQELLDLVAAGSLRPVVGRTVAMDGVAAALEDHAARRTAGRSVLDLSLPPG